MKVRLKELAIGSIVVFQGKPWTKKPSKIPFHFLLLSGDEKMAKLIHRDTYVEPLTIEYEKCTENFCND